jgi:peptidoglycan/LPS O-acetylase OafA/YrhL
MGFFRLLLALSVTTGHMGKSILGFHQLRPDIAVQCFYIISGFYMALILNEKYNRPHDYLVFIRQRFLRIYPTYAIIVVIIMLVEAVIRNGSELSCWSGWLKYGPHLGIFAGAYLALVNLTILGQDSLLFLAVNTHGDLYTTAHFQKEAVPCYIFLLCRPSWSLGVELLFYIVAPFLVRQKIALQIGVVLASLAVRIGLAVFLGLGDDPWSYRFFPSELSFFMAGSVGYQAYRVYGQQLARFITGKIWLVWLFWLSVFVYSRIPGNEDVRGDCFLIITAVMVPVLFAAYKNNARDRALGELSYPLYLLHFLIIYLLAPIYHNPFYTLLCLLLVLLCAYLFYHFVESPLENYRAALLRRERQREAKAGE